MGTIKLEIDLPEFEKELNISVTIRRDGEVTYTTSLPTGNTVKEISSPVSGSDPRFERALVEESIKSKPGRKKSGKTTKLTDNPESSSSNKQHGGNCMDMDF